jgi:hypothetical protein
MKALTLTQPWATLMALQQKTIETRSWATKYRGELVIHSAKVFPKTAKELCDREPFKSALDGYTVESLPLSHGLCVVRLIGCVPTTELYKVEFLLGRKPHRREIDFGNFDPGRYAWVTEYVRPIAGHRKVRGALSLWDWPEDDVAAIS